ncbi:MAG: hypothetical protein DMG24_07985 [Acidobacteria bacterium]|nr:MAG: hypothetical protein DMG24_07985 [Acidobacteriota bacterium]
MEMTYVFFFGAFFFFFGIVLFSSLWTQRQSFPPVFVALPNFICTNRDADCQAKYREIRSCSFA